MYLKTQGVATDNHPVKKELERVQLYLQVSASGKYAVPHSPAE